MNRRNELIEKLAAAQRILETELPAHDAKIKDADAAIDRARAALVAAVKHIEAVKNEAEAARTARQQAEKTFEAHRRETFVLLRASAPSCIDDFIRARNTELRELREQLSRLGGFDGYRVREETARLQEEIESIKALIQRAEDLKVTCADEAAAALRLEELSTDSPVLKG